MLNESQFSNNTVVCTFYEYDVGYGMQIVYDLAILKSIFLENNTLFSIINPLTRKRQKTGLRKKCTEIANARKLAL